jgi:beta-lactamase regulating signal transducer with metallopeptidase domain
MTEVWMAAARWLAHAALGGGLLLSLVCGGMALLRQPVRRQRLGEWGTVAALLVAALALGPAWIQISVPLPEEPVAAAALTMAQPPIAVSTDVQPPAGPEPGGDNPTPVPSGIVYYVPVEGVQPPAMPEPSENVATPAMVPHRASLDTQDIIRLVLALYVAGAVFLLGRWLIGYLWLWRLVGTSRPAPASAECLFREMATGLPWQPRLLVTRRLRLPVSCGLFQPTVLVPAAWCQRSLELRWVFAHELTHLRRRDAWSCLLFGLAQAVFFYLPWFWWLRRQVRLCQEYVADAAAAAQPSPVEEYAQFLLGLTMAPAVPAGATGVLGNSSDLYRRVTMLLKSPVSVEQRCPRLWLAATAGSLFLAAVCVSGVGLRAQAPAPRPPAVEELPARPAAPDDEQMQREIRKAAEKALQQLQNQDIRQAAEKALQQLQNEPQKELRKAVEEMQKALQQLQNLQPGANPEQMQRELQKAMADLQKAMAQQLDARRRAVEAAAVLGRDTIYFRRGGDTRLGVQVESPSAALMDQLGLNKGEGQVIMQIRPESPAAKAGLQTNDILLQLDGKAVPSDPREFAKLLEGIKANEAVEAVVLRKGKKETIKGLTLAEQPDAARLLIKMRAAAAVPVPPGVPIPPLPGPAGPVMLQLLGPAQNAVITTTVRTSDGFTTRYQEGSLIITLTGSTKDGKAKVIEIHVQDGGVTNKYESLDKVPKQYQDKAKNLIEMSEKSGTQIEIEKK